MLDHKNSQNFYATTILSVRKNGKVAIGGDGQVSFDKRVLYHMYREQRSKYNQLIINDKIRDQVDFVNSELLRKVSEKEVVKRPRLAQV
jgi:hypothetical protein